MWDYFEPLDRIWYRWNLNGAFAWLMKEGDIWRTAFKTVSPEKMNDDFGGPEEALPPEGVPVREAVGPRGPAALRPDLGEKPYLVAIPNPVRFFPGAEAYFDVLLPPALRFELSPDSSLSQAMPFALSESWFGDDPVSGRICLSLPPRFVSRHAGSPIPSLIRGALEVCNRSKAPAELDRLVIYPESLSLYTRGERVFSDTVAADFLPGGDLKIRTVPFEGGERINGRPHSVVGDILIRRGTDFIKEFTGTGL
jgi:hypothetical protein